MLFCFGLNFGHIKIYYFCSMVRASLTLLQSNPFQTIPRIDRVDWMGLTLLVSGLILLMILQYRNPGAIGSMVARSVRETSKKLYFAAPAIDSIDKLLFSLIYLVSGGLCVHFLFEEILFDTVPYMAYLAPLLLILFLFVPIRFLGFVVGYDKSLSKIIKRQMPLVFLTGIALLVLGLILFLKIDIGSLGVWVFMSLLLLFLLWMHVRVFQDLILDQISIFYIFMYFCTLEILPIFVLGVWISRN